MSSSRKTKVVDWDEDGELGKAFRNQCDPDAKANAIFKYKHRALRKCTTIQPNTYPSVVPNNLSRGVVEEHHQRRHIPPKKRLLIAEDISNGIHTTPISVYSDDIDDRSTPQPSDFCYIKQNIPIQDVPIMPPTKTDRDDTYCCSCKDGCDSWDCECLKLGRTPGFESVLDGDKIPQGRPSELGSFYDALFVGCGSRCACKPEKCGNRLRLNKGNKFEIFKRASKRRQIGFGVRTLTAIVPGQVVFEFSGEVVSHNELAQRPQTSLDYSLVLYDNKERNQRKQPLSGMMSALRKRRVFLPADDFYVDPYHHGNLARFCGHGCTHNLNLFRYAENDLNPHAHRILVVAKVAVLAGAELFIDYGEQYKSVYSCLCRTTECVTSGLGQLLGKMRDKFLPVPYEMARLNRLLLDYSKEVENDKLHRLIIGPYLEEEQKKAKAATTTSDKDAAMEVEGKKENAGASSKSRSSCDMRRQKHRGVLSDRSNLVDMNAIASATGGATRGTASKKTAADDVPPPVEHPESSSEDWWSTDSDDNPHCSLISSPLAKRQKLLSKRASEGASSPSSSSGPTAKTPSSILNSASGPVRRLGQCMSSRRNSEQPGDAHDRSASSASDSNGSLKGIEAGGILHQIQEEIDKLSQMSPLYSSLKKFNSVSNTTDVVHRNLQHSIMDPSHESPAERCLGLGAPRKDKRQVENKEDKENWETGARECDKENQRPEPAEVVAGLTSAGSAS